MRPDGFRRLSALCEMVGVVLLITSFIINPGPGANPTANELAVFGILITPRSF
jgi:hypothetical protein